MSNVLQSNFSLATSIAIHHTGAGGRTPGHDS